SVFARSKQNAESGMHHGTQMRFVVFLVALSVAPLASSCGDCAGVGLSRLRETERTIAVGASFTAIYEEGGSCSNTFAPAPPGIVRWTTSETSIIDVDSLSGRVTGKRVGDALVGIGGPVTTGPWSILVHVR